MRTKNDALRSLQKYVAQVLAPNARLSELTLVDGGTTYRWTVHSRVKGALNVSPETWRWLTFYDREQPVAVGSAAVPSSYYLSSRLVGTLAKLETAALADAVTVPTAGVPVAAFALENQPDWEVRTAYDRGEVPEDRPHALVKFVGPSGTRGPHTYYDVTQPMGISCYPMPGETVKESQLRAGAVEQVLLDAFRGAGVQLGRPLRIPMWDWDGIALDETSNTRNPSDFMRVLDFSVGQLPDPQEPRRIAVNADLRVSWRVDVDLTTLPTRTPGSVRGTRTVASVMLDIEGS